MLYDNSCANQTKPGAEFMNLKQAQYVKTIAECGSITAAAKKLFVSQPSLSQMLRQLEQETGDRKSVV